MCHETQHNNSQHNSKIYSAEIRNFANIVVSQCWLLLRRAPASSQNVVLLSFVTLRVFMLSVVMLSVVMLSAVMLSVGMLSDTNST